MVRTLTSHMQFLADVQEPHTPPSATMHRQAMNKKFPGDTVESNTKKDKNLNIKQKVILIRLARVT